jgi:hypothetical protein
VYGYESGKDEKQFAPRPDVGNTSFRLEQRARAEARNPAWLELIAEPGATEPRVFIGPIAAGEKLVKSTKSSIWRFLNRQYSDALAVEQEGRGFLHAAFANPGVDAVVVRGISDLIDDKDLAERQGSQATASANATAFAFRLLSQTGVERGAPADEVLPITPELVRDLAGPAAQLIPGGSSEPGHVEWPQLCVNIPEDLVLRVGTLKARIGTKCAVYFSHRADLGDVGNAYASAGREALQAEGTEVLEVNQKPDGYSLTPTSVQVAASLWTANAGIILLFGAPKGTDALGRNVPHEFGFLQGQGKPILLLIEDGHEDILREWTNISGVRAPRFPSGAMAMKKDDDWSIYGIIRQFMETTRNGGRS